VEIFGPSKHVARCSDVLRARCGDIRCPGDSASRGYPYQGDHETALRCAISDPRLDSLPTGACILTRKGEAPVRTACNLELATDFGGMHLPPAVKGHSVLCRVLLTRHPRDESSRRSSRSGAEPAPRPLKREEGIRS
jgi:hypothetical protein